VEVFDRAVVPFTDSCELLRPETVDLETPSIPAEGSLLLRLVEADSVPEYVLDPPDEPALEVREASRLE